MQQAIFGASTQSMKLPQPIPVSKLADWLNARLLGDESIEVSGINEIHKVQPGDLSFVDHPKYYNRSLNSAANVVLINQEVNVPYGKALLISEDPFRDFNQLVQKYSPFRSASAMIDPDTSIGPGTVIEPGVFIGRGVSIGADCLIHPNVTIYSGTKIGDRVIIQSNTVVGSDAFYFKKRQERLKKYDKLLSCGRVIIHDDVEIGSGCTIDRGVSGETVIGAGSKLDNQVHIGHGVTIGQNCLIAAQVGIAGKTILEDDVVLWGQVGVNKSLTIGRGAVVYAQSGVPKSIEGGQTYFGSPVGLALDKMKELAAMKQLPFLLKSIRNHG